MTFFESIITCFKKMLVMDQRARRSEFWWFFLFSAAVISVSVRVGSQSSIMLLKFLALVLIVACTVSVITACVRRLNDVGVSQKWAFAAIVPFLGWAVLIGFCVRNSVEGPNDYGPCPKEPKPEKKKKSKKGKK